VVLVLHPDLRAGTGGEQRPGIVGRRREDPVHEAGGFFEGRQVEHAGVSGKRRAPVAFTALG
jgi:hypothetical protein